MASRHPHNRLPLFVPDKPERDVAAVARQLFGPTVRLVFMRGESLNPDRWYVMQYAEGVATFLGYGFTWMTAIGDALLERAMREHTT